MKINSFSIIYNLRYVYNKNSDRYEGNEVVLEAVGSQKYQFTSSHKSWVYKQLNILI